MDNGNSVSNKKSASCPMEQVPLDTVRALHSTVVSLRSALEEAKTEIQRLRNQISTETEVKEGNKKREKIIRFVSNSDNLFSENAEKIHCHPGIDIKHLEIPEIIEIPITPTTPTNKINQDTYRKSPKSDTASTPKFCSTTRDQETFRRFPKSPEKPDISIFTIPSPSGVCDNKMAQKIDVKIKVTSNIKVHGEDDCKSEEVSAEYKDSDERPGDINFSTEEHFTVRSHKKDSQFTVSSKENLNIHDDSLSDGDNSVFEKGDNSKVTEPREESKEECDDIELIFSSGEQRDPIQEELISLSEFDPWKPCGDSGTPVLVKFSSLQSDQDGPDKPILTTSSTCDVFPKEKSLESTTSLDQAQQSSLDREISLDQNANFGRDESLDFFDHETVGRKWTNQNVLVETDISKCGIVDENHFEFYHRRNTCPNPPAYRPMLSRIDPVTRHIPSRLASKYCRRLQYNSNIDKGPKRSSSAQTEISALPEYWRSECQLAGNRYLIGAPCTLPSKFVPSTKKTCQKHNIRVSNRNQEARRVLLSDINFTSMVPELSRSADHLCPDENRQDGRNNQPEPSPGYYKGNLLRTPDYCLKGFTPSTSVTSPGLSQWSFGTQTIQTGDSLLVNNPNKYGRGDSLDSCKSYNTSCAGSRLSGLDRHHRSRSVPSVRCAICKHARGMRTSESMQYTPKVTFQEPNCKTRGSLPDLRQECLCGKRGSSGRTIFTIHGDSSGSTESLLDEADVFVRKSLDSSHFKIETCKKPNLRRMSENDIQKDYIPSKQSLPFLPKTSNCLRPGHLAKVITKSGRVVVGRVRYIGPIVQMQENQNPNSTTSSNILDDICVGVQLQSKCGDCNGTFEGRKFFECEPLQGLFVPFKKVIMAWTE